MYKLARRVYMHAINEYGIIDHELDGYGCLGEKYPLRLIYRRKAWLLVIDILYPIRNKALEPKRKG